VVGGVDQPVRAGHVDAVQVPGGQLRVGAVDREEAVAPAPQPDGEVLGRVRADVARLPEDLQGRAARPQEVGPRAQRHLLDPVAYRLVAEQDPTLRVLVLVGSVQRVRPVPRREQVRVEHDGHGLIGGQPARSRAPAVRPMAVGRPQALVERTASRTRSTTASGWASITRCEESTSRTVIPARW